MANVIRLALRGSDRLEDVDLDELTPRARAFAECIYDCAGHRPLEIKFERPALVRDTQYFQDLYGPGPYSAEIEEKGAQRQTGSTRNWSLLREKSPRTPIEWLENEVRTLPELDAYPVAAAPRSSYGAQARARVPSADAGAADTYVPVARVNEYLREQGCRFSPHGWDTLIGTGHLPEPDRFVCDRPQWLPATLDAYAHRPRDLWTTSRVAEYLGYEGPSAPNSAARQLGRWGLVPERREPGRGGENLYPADQVIAAQAHRPGRGRRTDLTPR